jgi:nucleotide-binding universal stress UspA family protein
MDTTTTQTSERSPAPMQTCLPDVGDVLIIVGSPGDAAVLVGSRLAARTGGSVTGCGVSMAFLGGRPFRTDATVVALLEPSPRVKRHDDLKSSGEGAEFVRRATTAGARHPQWAVVGNDVGHDLKALSAWHDLIVVQRPNDELANPVDGLEHLVKGTGLPCLILPKVCAPCGVFERVVLAWDGSQPATRAIRAALPLIGAAKEVVLLDGTHPDTAPVEPTFHPLAFLARHGIEASHHRIRTSPGDAGAVLLAKAKHFKADLLVMGAYGHTPLRERILGGATRHVLTHGYLATLLCH